MNYPTKARSSLTSTFYIGLLLKSTSLSRRDPFVFETSTLTDSFKSRREPKYSNRLRLLAYRF